MPLQVLLKGFLPWFSAAHSQLLMILRCCLSSSIPREGTAVAVTVLGHTQACWLLTLALKMLVCVEKHCNRPSGAVFQTQAMGRLQ